MKKIFKKFFKNIKKNIKNVLAWKLLIYTTNQTNKFLDIKNKIGANIYKQWKKTVRNIIEICTI